MNPYILSTMLLGLLTGTTITLTSTHWLLAWMGLEINTLAIIPLMSQHHHPRAVEAATKYFLIQATAAAMILFATTTNAWMTGQWDLYQLNNPTSTAIILIALALKVGIAPMHAWLPEVLQGLDLTTGLILSTWQKIAPFAIILQIQPTNPDIMILLGITSTLVGGWGGINQTQLRKILAYSSIAHLGWMILVLQFYPMITLLTLIIYIMMTTATFLLFKMNKSTNINSLATSWTKTPTMTTLTPLILLSLGGLPPLTGFMPKWLILQELSKQELATIATMAALSALLSLYFYLRISYTMTLTMSPNNLPGTTPWRVNNNQTSLMMTTTTSMTILMLPLTPTLLSLTSF